MSDGMSDRQMYWHGEDSDMYKFNMEKSDMCGCPEDVCTCKADVALATMEQIKSEIAKLELDEAKIAVKLKDLEEQRKQLLIAQIRVDAALSALKHLDVK